ncbi:MAG: CPBP family intramembrane glutamic endopeptidase [Acidobacteriota bacterium]
MASHLTLTTARPLIPFRAAIIVTVAMAVVYTALDVLQPPELMQSLLAFIPGGLSLLALGGAGLSRTDLNLRFATISRPGLAVLGATTLLLLPILAPNTGWIGWQWIPALVIAPASGIAQELYFRGALLPGLEHLFTGKKTLALLVHSAIFIGFHLRTFRSIPMLPMVFAVAVVLFLAGCGWGWQVQRDRTVVWTMLQHSLFLVLMSMFAWG